MGTYLLNTTGTNKVIDPAIQLLQVPNAKYLMPAKHNAMVIGSYPFSPIFSGSMAVIYSFNVNSITLSPTLTFGLMENLDLDLIGQLFYQEIPSASFKNIGNGIYWRIKRSF